MATEYVLYLLDDIQEANRVSKLKSKISLQLEKVFDGNIEKETDEEIKKTLETLKERIINDIDKDIVSSVNSIPICTVATNKTYIEMPYAELEKRMEASACIIQGDDGSKYKNPTALKKYYV